MARGGDVELTEELLRERPLELLNADAEELRAWLRGRMEPAAERHLSRRAALLKGMGGGTEALSEEEIEEQVALAVRTLAAMREAFTVADSEVLDAARMSAAVSELDDAWRELRPALRERIALFTVDGAELLDNPEKVATALETLGDDAMVLRCVSVPDPPGAHPAWEALELAPGHNLWEWLMRLLERAWQERLTEGKAQVVLCCPECGRLFSPPATGRPPVYCSPNCRKRAWEKRH